MSRRRSPQTFGLPPCPDLDAGTLRLLLAEAEAVEMSSDDVVFSRGDPARYLYFVRSGRLRQREERADGRDRRQARPPGFVGAGDLFGVTEVLSGQARSSTVEVRTVAELLRLPVARLNEVLAENPGATHKLVEVAERQLLRREMVRLLPDVFAALEPDALQDLSSVFRWLRLDRGETLFVEGGPGEALYVLASGRLEARVWGSRGESRVVGEIVPGETVGEMALLTDEPRGATVVAMRASVLQVCRRDDFLALVERHPVLARHVTNVLVQRLNRANRNAASVQRRLSIAVLPLHADLESRAFTESLASEFRHGGRVLHLDQAGVEERLGEGTMTSDARLRDLRLLPWFEEQESTHDFVLYDADADFTPWTRRCVSQADRIILVADADRPPDLTALETAVEEVLEGARPPIHLVLVHPSDRDRPRGTASWLDHRDVHAHHHIRRGRSADVARVGRLLTGRGVGLVLSGGGARGFAHIGVLRVLEELGIEVDAIGGTSAGAAVGGQYAMGRSPQEIRDAAWRDMVQARPFRKYTLPVYSIASRHALDDVCRSIAGDHDLADLWIPFFCTSSDLQTGEKVIHTRGPLWKAARASMSLPGIVPPVIEGDRLLVDGGVLDNIPEEEMQDFCGGRVIAVDVSSGAPTPFDFEYDDMPSPWRVALDQLLPWRKAPRVPTLRDVLTRTAIVSNTGQGDVEQNVDLLLRPPVSSFGLMEFGAIDRIIELAEEHSRAELKAWRTAGDWRAAMSVRPSGAYSTPEA